MDFGDALILYWVGWFSIWMIGSHWSEGYKDRENIMVYIIWSWMIGGTFFILTKAGVF